MRSKKNNKHKHRVFFLLKPKEKLNAKDFAMRISMISGVKEVNITSGDFGFVVVAESNDEAVAEKFVKEIYAKNSNCCSACESHYTFKNAKVIA